MTVAIAHRGPDDEYFHREPGLALGTRRLAIVDLAGGRQPLANEDETVWVSFNGELFDYPELRQQLLVRGHHLANRRDTELWVHLYEDHGEGVFERARGQFGVALWDRRNRILLLGRDSMTVHQDARLYLASLFARTGGVAPYRAWPGGVAPGSSRKSEFSRKRSLRWRWRCPYGREHSGGSSHWSFRSYFGRNNCSGRGRTRATPTAPPTPRHHGISRNSASVLRPEMVRRAHCPVMVVKAPARAAGAPTPPKTPINPSRGSNHERIAPGSLPGTARRRGRSRGSTRPDRYPADRARGSQLNYRQPDAWSRRAIINVGHSDKFFIDRTIMEYARSIWSAEACPVDQS